MECSHQRLLIAHASESKFSYVTEQCDGGVEFSWYSDTCEQSSTTGLTDYGTATLIVLADGELGRAIECVANTRIAFDAIRRRVVGPSCVLTESLEKWRRRHVAAIMLDASGTPCAILDKYQAVSEAWMENAFVIAKRR